MKRFIKNIAYRVNSKPFHSILGAVMIAFGIYLIFEDQYFDWPPQALKLVNSDFFGTWAIFDGLGILYVVFSTVELPRADFTWLLSTAAFLGFESAMELAHVCLGLPRHTAGFVILILGFLLLTFALTKKR